MTDDPAPPSLRVIVDEHLAVIRRYLASLGVRQADLDDVVQEVLHGAFRAAKTYDSSRSDLRSWLQGIAFRQAVNYLRRAHHRRERLWATEDLEALPDDAPDSEEQLVDESLRQFVRELLSEIAPERREVLIAFEIDQLPMEQVAQELSIPITTGWSRLRNAREDFAAAARRRRARDRTRAITLLPFLVDALIAFFRRHTRHPLDATAPPSEGLLGSPYRRAFASYAAQSVVGVVVLGVLVPGHDQSHPALALRSTSQRQELAGQRLTASPRSRAVPLPALETASPGPATPIVSVPPAVPKNARHPAAPDPARLIRERKLIQHATAALFAGDLSEAARVLAQHEREFPTGLQAGTRDALLAQLRTRTLAAP